MYENDYTTQNACSDVNTDVNAQDDVYAEQASCFMTRGGRVCRDPRRGIECFYPFVGSPSCRRFGPGRRPF
jgi:hypothetical protein